MMIKIDEVSDGVFQVVFTEEDLGTLDAAATTVDVSRNDVLQTWLMFVIVIYDNVLVKGRNRDELERKDG